MSEAAVMIEREPGPEGPASAGFARSRSLHNRAARLVNGVVITLCYFAALVTILILFCILGYIVYRGATSLNWALFTHLPGDTPSGLSNAISGTLVLIAMASCIGIPLGMSCGIYLAEYARDNWFSHTIRLVVDVLAGVPSIIVGVLGYEIMVITWRPFEYGSSGPANAIYHVLNWLIAVRLEYFPTGYSAWAGMIALGFMMCPIIARTTEEMLKLVPKALREASVGLGASRAQTLVRVVIPAAKSGIITGIMLAVARVAGETAPLLFTVLGYDQSFFVKSDKFPYFMDLSHNFPSLTIKIFEYAGSAVTDWQRQAWAGMLILITIVLVLNILVRVASRQKKYG